MAEQKNIQYINKEFADFKSALVDFTKTYFPDSYNDFTPASPGSLFIDLAAYVGDVLSFYQDTQLQETFVQYAKEKENLYSLAYMLGYKPKVTTASTSKVTFYQLLPATTSGSVTVPDFSYAMTVKEGARLLSDENGIEFFVPDKIDFSVSSSLDPTKLSVYQINSTSNLPEYYLLEKKANVISGTVKTTTFDFGSPEKFPTILLEDDNIIQIISVLDSDGNQYHEVPYLAQETIFEDVQNTSINDPNLNGDKDNTPYLLRLKKVPRRFTTRLNSSNQVEIQFGSGISTTDNEEIIPNPDNVGLGLPDGITKLNIAYDPSNFLYTSTYGVAPYNTTLTITYLVGGGVESNVSSNTITTIDQVETSFNVGNLDNGLSNQVINSLAVNNEEAASGGGSGDTLEELRLNILSSFPTQLRSVTKEDYIVRVMSLPQRYGSVAKAYMVQDAQLSKNDINDSIIDNNPLSLSLYVLGYNSDRQLVKASNALKQNLKTYLSQYRLLTDAINIKDAFVINISVKFDIITLPNFNNNQVLLDCVNEVKSYFDIDKRQINQPIILNEIYNLLDRVRGVQTVSNVEIENKTGEINGYSKYGYDIGGATRNNVIYPSLDPCIFEVKYPNTDIVGRVLSV